MGDLAVRKARLPLVSRRSSSPRADLQCILTLALSAISMNRRTRQSHVVQEVVKQIRLALVVHKHQGAGRGHGHKEIIEGFLLQVLLHEDNLDKINGYQVDVQPFGVLTF